MNRRQAASTGPTVSWPPLRLLMPPELKTGSEIRRAIKDLAASYELGVNAYVVKPVDFHELVNAIKELGVFWAVVNAPPPGSVRK